MKKSREEEEEKEKEKETNLTECPYCCSPIGKVTWDPIYKIFICTVCDNKWREGEEPEDFFEKCPHCNSHDTAKWESEFEEWQCNVCGKNLEKE